jgi:hypothetical protein
MEALPKFEAKKTRPWRMGGHCSRSGQLETFCITRCAILYALVELGASEFTVGSSNLMCYDYNQSYFNYILTGMHLLLSIRCCFVHNSIIVMPCHQVELSKLILTQILVSGFPQEMRTSYLERGKIKSGQTL